MEGVSKILKSTEEIGTKRLTAQLSPYSADQGLQ